MVCLCLLRKKLGLKWVKINASNAKRLKSAGFIKWNIQLGDLARVKSGKFGHKVNSDTHLQTVEIQTRLIRIFTVC